MKIDIYQIFYDKAQKAQLDPDAIPISTAGRDMAPYFENEVILELAESGELSKDLDYVGVTSWRMHEKTHLTVKSLKTYIENNPGKDAYLYGAFGSDFDLLYNKQSVVGVVWDRLNHIAGRPPSIGWVQSFCNFWIVKRKLWDEYIEFLKTVVDGIDSDEMIDWICSTRTFRHRDADYPSQVFIAEYAFGVWLYNTGRTYEYIPRGSKGLPPGANNLQRKLAKNMEEQKPLAAIYNRYKAEAGWGDKGTLHHYIENYDKLFSALRNRPITILEIGVCHGHSLLMWREYFPLARVIGIDINEPSMEMKNIEFHQCSQNDGDALDMALRGTSFDIIIDDGSHVLSDQIYSIRHLWERLNWGGIYVIEDLQDPESDIGEMGKQFKAPSQILDTRDVSGRYDDVLAVWHKTKLVYNKKK